MFLGTLAFVVLVTTQCSAQGLRPLRIRGQSLHVYNSTASITNSTTSTTSKHTSSPSLTSTSSSNADQQSTSLITSTKQTSVQQQASSSPAVYVPSSSSAVGTGVHPYSSSSSPSSSSTKPGTGSSIPYSSSNSSHLSPQSSILGTGAYISQSSSATHSSSSLLTSSSKALGTGSSVPSASSNGSHGSSASVPLRTGGHSLSHSLSYTTRSYSYAPSGGSSPLPTNSSTPIGYTTQSYSYVPSGGGSPLPGNSTAPNGYAGTGTSPHRPTGTSTTANSTSSTSTNATCSGATLNVLDASLDWWYTRTLYNAVSTFSLQFNRNDSQTGWTLIPATTSFDLNSAIETEECTSSLTYNSQYNTSLWDINCTPAPTPVAADTTVITQTAYVSPAVNTGTGTIPNVVITPPPATATIPGDGSFPEGEAFVYFSAYEIVSKNPTTFGNGSVGCAAVATSTYTMDSPFSFEYNGGEVNGSKEVGAGVTGDVNPAFLGVVGQSSAKAGSWVAAPTVVIIVQDVFEAEGVLAAMVHGTLTTEPSLMTPTPTLPSGVTKGSTDTGKGITKTATRGTVLEQQSSLDVVPPPPKTGKKTTKSGGGGQKTTTAGPGQQSPGHKSPTNSPGGHNTSPAGSPGQQSPGSRPSTTVAPFVATHHHSTVTLEIGVRPKQTIVTAEFSGETVIATRITTKPGVGGIVSAIKSVLKPTNALQVLTQAQLTYPNGHNGNENPTVSAILHGIHTGSPGSPNPSPGSVHTAPVIVIGGKTRTANSAAEFSLGKSATLTPGGTAVVSGTTYSLLPGASVVVVNGHTSTLSQATITAAPAGPPVLTIGGHTYTPSPGTTYVINGQTLTPGGVITEHGTTISLAPGASSIVVNGATENIAATKPNSNPALVTSPPVLSIGGETFTPINNGPTYNVNGETLTPGEQETVTVHGTTYIVSLAPGASVLEIETEGPGGQVKATTFETLTPGPGPMTAPPVLTIGSESFTPINNGPTYNINGETLTPGEKETVTVDGKTYVISLEHGATVLVIETEGPGGAITATTYETLTPGVGPRPTVTDIVDATATASAGSRSSSGVVQQTSRPGASLQNSAESIRRLELSVLAVAFGSMALAILL